jgi:hypothetical protein
VTRFVILILCGGEARLAASEQQIIELAASVII